MTPNRGPFLLRFLSVGYPVHSRYNKGLKLREGGEPQWQDIKIQTLPKARGT